MIRQKWDVGATFAQRRQEERHDAESVEQVRAKAASGDFFAKRTVRGGDDTNVHGLSVGAAHRLDLPLLKDTQELRLNIERQLAHLVQEERATISRTKMTWSITMRTGERAFDMPEELTFQ